MKDLECYIFPWNRDKRPKMAGSFPRPSSRRSQIRCWWGPGFEAKTRPFCFVPTHFIALCHWSYLQASCWSYFADSPKLGCFVYTFCQCSHMGTFVSVSKKFCLWLFGITPKLTPCFFRVQRVCQYLLTWLLHHNLPFVGDQKWMSKKVTIGQKMAPLTLLWFMLIFEKSFFLLRTRCSFTFKITKFFFYSDWKCTSWKRPCSHVGTLVG